MGKTNSRWQLFLGILVVAVLHAAQGQGAEPALTNSTTEDTEYPTLWRCDRMPSYCELLQTLLPPRRADFGPNPHSALLCVSARIADPDRNVYLWLQVCDSGENVIEAELVDASGFDIEKYDALLRVGQSAAADELLRAVPRRVFRARSAQAGELRRLARKLASPRLAVLPERVFVTGGVPVELWIESMSGRLYTLLMSPDPALVSLLDRLVKTLRAYPAEEQR